MCFSSRYGWTLLILVLALSCTKKSIRANSFNKQNPIEVSVQFVPEDTNGWYSLTWLDTIGEGQEWTTLERPLELHCHVFNLQGDTLGYYHGLSTPQTYLYFQCKDPGDSIVQVQFEIGMNTFSEFLYDSKERIDAYWEEVGTGYLLETMEVNLQSTDRGWHDWSLKPRFPTGHVHHSCLLPPTIEGND